MYINYWGPLNVFVEIRRKKKTYIFMFNIIFSLMSILNNKSLKWMSLKNEKITWFLKVIFLLILFFQNIRRFFISF